MITAERAFRNTVALSLLLLGLAIVFYAIGSVLAVATQLWATGISWGAINEAAFPIVSLGIALLFFFIGLSLIRARPRYDTGLPHGVRHVGPAALMAARTFSIILFVLGVLFLFDVSPYGRDVTLAAVMILGGVFGVAATILYARADPNVAALGAVLAILAAAMILYAQLTVDFPAGPSQTFGAWETTNLVVPPVLGPIAIILTGACGLLYAYATRPSWNVVAFIGLGVAALTYGLGLCLVGLATFFDLPYYQFFALAGSPMVQMLAMAAGTTLLVAAGVCCIVAALVSFVRTARRFETRTATVPPTTPTGPTQTTGSTTVGRPTDSAWQRLPEGGAGRTI